MSNYLTLPFKKSVLMARVSAMTQKAAEQAASAPDEQNKRTALVQKVTGSPEDIMLLQTSLRSAVDSFFVFVAGEAFGIQHISDSLSDSADDFTIEMDRPPRFNEAMRQPLLSQVGDFIVRSMLFQWYSAFSADMAQAQAALLPNIQFSISRCFRKVDVSPLSGLFPDTVKFNRASIPDIICTGDAFSISYDIAGSSPHPVNDIELTSSDVMERIVKCEIIGRRIQVWALSEGSVTLHIQSYHNDSVSDSVTLTVTPYV